MRLLLEKVVTRFLGNASTGLAPVIGGSQQLSRMKVGPLLNFTKSSSFRELLTISSRIWQLQDHSLSNFTFATSFVAFIVSPGSYVCLRP